jgi:hypothetical protein
VSKSHLSISKKSLEFHHPNLKENVKSARRQNVNALRIRKALNEVLRRKRRRRRSEEFRIRCLMMNLSQRRKKGKL